MQLHTDVVLVSVAVPDEPLAQDLSRRLLQERLAACCQILGPMRSLYRWQGAIESATEFLLLLKTRQPHLVELEELVRKHHPYDVPEILVTPLQGGHDPYLEWVSRETTRHRSP
jgi:periplasmic divalent cation tolerance protein